MRIFLFTISVLFVLVGCSESKSDRCEKAFNNVIALTKSDPDMQKNPDRLKSRLEKLQKSKRHEMKECVGEFTPQELDCFIGAKTIRDFKKCK